MNILRSWLSAIAAAVTIVVVGFALISAAVLALVHWAMWLGRISGQYE